MYRMNPYNRSTPRDRLDPRMLDRISDDYNRRALSDCGCENARIAPRAVCPSCEQNANARNEMQNNCGCNNIGEDYAGEFNYALAMVYSPVQEFQNLYCEEEGLKAGTIFKELDKPFYGPKCHGGCHHE